MPGSKPREDGAAKKAIQTKLKVLSRSILHLRTIIIAQIALNTIRAFPIFVLERYILMILVFSAAVSIACGWFGGRLANVRLLMMYSILGTLSMIGDIITVALSMHHGVPREIPHEEEINWVYSGLVFSLCCLNLYGGVFRAPRLVLFITSLRTSVEQERKSSKRRQSSFDITRSNSFDLSSLSKRSISSDRLISSSAPRGHPPLSSGAASEVDNLDLLDLDESEAHSGPSSLANSKGRVVYVDWIPNESEESTMEDDLEISILGWSTPARARPALRRFQQLTSFAGGSRRDSAVVSEAAASVAHNSQNKNDSNTWDRSAPAGPLFSFRSRFFVSNEVQTAKYNVVTFLFKVLYFQFSRLANLYTAFIVFLSFFEFSPVGPLSSIVPLAVVLSTSMIKEFLEDRKRHASDREVNSRKTRVLRCMEHGTHNILHGSSSNNILLDYFFQPKKQQSKQRSSSSSPYFETVQWKDIHVGDLICVRDGDLLPADIVVLATSNPDGRCSLETSNLDGETNLKLFSRPSQLSWVQTEQQLASLSIRLESEAPNNRLYTFEGVLNVEYPSLMEHMGISSASSSEQSRRRSLFPSDSGNVQSSSSDIASASHVESNYNSSSASSSIPLSQSETRPDRKRAAISLSADSVLLRGTCLKNTDWVWGLVVFTGSDTKVEQNATVAPHKRSALERSVNTKLLLLFFFQILICIICSVGANKFELEKHSKSTTFHQLSKPWYIFPPDLEVESQFVFISYIILYNTMIPLSMYVSMEAIRLIHASLISSDLAMYSAIHDLPAQARNTNINEELGQLQYVFSDKTGTLTENELIFSRFSAAGRKFGSSLSSSSSSANSNTNPNPKFIDSDGAVAASLASKSPESEIVREFLMLLAICNTAAPLTSSSSNVNCNDNASSAPISNDAAVVASVAVDKSVSDVSPLILGSVQVIDAHERKSSLLFPKTPSQQRPTTPLLKSAGDNSLTSPRYGLEKPAAPHRHSIRYMCTSPDEEALLEAARDLDFVLLSREDEVVSVSVDGEIEKFEVLGTLEFSSDRKRMSTLVRRVSDGRIRLYTKGADSIIVERLRENDPLQAVTMSHVSEFARTGLRTLCMAYRDIDAQEYEDWKARYTAATMSLSNRSELVEKAAESIERNLTLLGCTGIEDRLQEGVEDTITALREAGIRFWVLTGDKQETAISIGESAGILKPDMIQFILSGADLASLSALLDEMEATVAMHYGHFTSISSPRDDQGRPQIVQAEHLKPLTVAEKMNRWSASIMASIMQLLNVPVPSRILRTANGVPDDTEPFIEQAEEHHDDSGVAEHIVRDSAHEEASGSHTARDAEAGSRTARGGINGTRFAIVIDGPTLNVALSPALRFRFLQRARECASVIVCRASPLQKARVVSLVSERNALLGDGAITLAIGDGANDCAMLQRAHVGVGISAGKEGMQAVLASDFAIPKFKYLKRLVLVHGNRDYARISKLVLYSFCKNLALVFPNFWLGFFSMFSGQMMYFDFLFTCYNALFTAIPILTLASTHQDDSAEELERRPHLYKRGQSNDLFSNSSFAGYVLYGLYQSLVVFAIPFLAFGTMGGDDGDSLGGRTLGLFGAGTTAYACLVISTNLQILLTSLHWTKPLLFASLGSIVFFFAFMALYSSPLVIVLVGQYQPYGVWYALLASPTFWLCLLLAVPTAVLPMFMHVFFQKHPHLRLW